METYEGNFFFSKIFFLWIKTKFFSKNNSDVEEDDLEVDPISSEDGEDDEEESEDGEDSDKSDNETNKAGNTSKDQQNGFYWDKLRLDEIAMQADIKPDISKIRILNSDTINEIADKSIDILLGNDLLKVTDPEKVDEDEELAALYGSLNPDDWFIKILSKVSLIKIFILVTIRWIWCFFYCILFFKCVGDKFVLIRNLRFFFSNAKY